MARVHGGACVRLLLDLFVLAQREQAIALRLKVVYELHPADAELLLEEGAIDRPSVLHVCEGHLVVTDGARAREAARRGHRVARLLQENFADVGEVEVRRVEVLLAEYHLAGGRLSHLELVRGRHLEERQPSVGPAAIATHHQHVGARACSRHLLLLHERRCRHRRRSRCSRAKADPCRAGSSQAAQDADRHDWSWMEQRVSDAEDQELKRTQL